MQNKLPKDWQQKTLGDILKITSGSGLTKSKRNDNGEFFVYGGNGITGRHTEYLFEEERLIIGRVGVHCGNAYITNPKSWVTDNAFVVSFNEDEINKKFLLNLIGVLNLNKYSVSTAQPVISQGTIYPIEITLPPMETQQAIVSKIEELFSELDKGIEDLKTAQQQLKTYRQSVLKWAFEGKLTNENVKDGELPKGWEIMKFGEVVNNYDGKRRPLSRDVRAKRQGKFRYYGATEIVDYIDDFLFDGKYLLIGEDGANLVSKSRSLAFIVEGKFWVNNHAHIVQTKELLNIDFLSYYFNSLNLAEYVTGTAQPKLNQANMNKIPIPTPKIEEQYKIVEELESRLSVADKMEESIAQSLQQAEALRQSILKKAFSGELV